MEGRIDSMEFGSTYYLSNSDNEFIIECLKIIMNNYRQKDIKITHISLGNNQIKVEAIKV